MTVKIKNKELFKRYTGYIKLSYDGEWTLTHTIQSFLMGVVASSLDINHDDEISTIIKAIIDGEPVELVGQKFLIYVPLTEDECAQYFHGWSGIDWAGNYTAHLCKDDEHQFTQYEVDELKKKYPYIQTKEVEE